VWDVQCSGFGFGQSVLSVIAHTMRTAYALRPFPALIMYIVFAGGPGDVGSVGLGIGRGSGDIGLSADMGSLDAGFSPGMNRSRL
jgi:hypothetical protein